MKAWLGQRVHAYYFILYFFVGICAGVALSLAVWPGMFASVMWPVLATLLVAVAAVRFRRWAIVLMLISGSLLGLWRGSVTQQQALEYEPFFGQTVVLSGVVVEDVTTVNEAAQRFKLRDVVIEGRQMGGEVWVSSRSLLDIKRSDTVTVEGFLSEGFGSFNASLLRAEVQSVKDTSKSDAGLVVRDNFAEATSAIKEPERSLGLGYLLGIKAALPEDLATKIQILGLTHVVVASGYNLTILVTFTRRLFASYSKYLAVATGGSMIAGFILITGFSPSMSRAGLVAGLSLMAWYYGRKFHPATLLVIVAGLTLLIRPSYLSGDLGWYLSFLAFFGILVLAPLLHHYFWGDDKKPSAVRELIMATFAAQIMTLPLIIYSFGAFSWYALLANALILPIIPLCMLAVFLAGMAGLMAPFLAGVFAWPANVLLSYCTTVIDKVSALPNAYTELVIADTVLVISYAFLALLTVVLIRVTGHNFLKDKTIVE